MSAPTEYGILAGESELAEVSRLVSLAFAGPLEGSTQWMRDSGLENVRVLREEEGRGGGRVRACLLRIPMGQHFGGRAVPMVGVAGVAVGPESRGRGLARRMMAELMRELAAEGAPLSALYASTQALYRQVGYEQAGHRFNVRIPLAQIGVRSREPRVEALEEEDLPAIKACYAEFARRFDGMLDRGAYVWERVRKRREEAFHPFGVRGDSGAIEGYLFLTQRRKPDTGRHDVVLSDLAFTSAAAGRRLLGFLADFATVGDDLLFAGGPAHPILTLMDQQRYAIEFKDYWMLRVVDVAAALEARGYAPGIDAEVRLDVRDDVLERNTGRFVLRVRDGRGRVERAEVGAGGVDGAVRCGPRGLAALYGGFMSPGALALGGLVEGGPEALRAAGAVFAGSTPWMTDFF